MQVVVPDDGFIDLHCHLLPGIDDGCREVEQSLECMRLWSEAGFSGSVCTPHMGSDWFPENTPARVRDCLLVLNRQLARSEVKYTLWPGGELRLSNTVIAWCGEHGVPTLGPGKCVLIDWWGAEWPSYCTDVCQWLLDGGYQPLLAHPERMGLDDGELTSVLADLKRRGVWLQGNLNSLSGGEGATAMARGEQLLLSDAYHVIATDTHAPHSLPSRRAGIARIRELAGEAKLQLLLRQRPREVLLHGAANASSVSVRGNKE